MAYARVRRSRRGIRRSIKRRSYRKGRGRSAGRASLRLGSYRPRRVIPRSLFPNKCCVQLTYATTTRINPGAAGVLAYHDFAANGLFDPDLTGTGHQPRGFDNLTPFYKKLTVVGSKITCTFTGGTTANQSDFVYGVLLDSTGQTPPSDYVNIQETGMAKLRFAAFDGQPGGTKIITKGFSAKKHMSVTNPLDEPNLASDITSNPSTLARFHVFAGHVGRSDDIGHVDVNVVIRYTVVGTDRIRSPQD